MKEKKTGAKKILLMAISCVLVAAISVSLTLAYLTAKTNEKDNLFKATGGVKGEVIEPAYDVEKAVNYRPGRKIPKNPMVDNDTEEYDVWVGASVEFLLSAQKDGSGNPVYVTVPYETFKQFVDVEKYVGDEETWPSSTLNTKWDKLTATKTSSPEKDKGYFFYNNVLLKDDTNASETAATEADNGANGTIGNENTKDNTTPLFESVTPKADLEIDPNYSGTKTLVSSNNAIPGYGTGTGSNPAISVSNPLTKYAFSSFNFKIKIVGYGIQDNDTDVPVSDKLDYDSDNNQNKSTTSLNDTSTTYEKVTGEILDKLGGKAAS